MIQPRREGAWCNRSVDREKTDRSKKSCNRSVRIGKNQWQKKTKLRIFLGSARAAVGRRAVHQFGSGKTKDIKTDRNKKKVQQIQFGKKPASKKDQN